MPETPVLAPGLIPEIAVDSMNATHHEEVALVNVIGGLLEAARQGEADNDAISRALDEWVEHTEAHFARENQLMEEHGFPPYPVHAEEHRNALEEIHQIQQAWHENQALDPLADYIFKRWPEWFLTHVNSMDRVTALFLSNLVN